MLQLHLPPGNGWTNFSREMAVFFGYVIQRFDYHGWLDVGRNRIGAEGWGGVVGTREKQPSHIK
jgi:hypothetical protein